MVPGGRVIDIELDTPRLALLTLVLLALLAGAFTLGRQSAGGSGGGARSEAAPPLVEDAEPTFEEVEESETIFDRAGGDTPRETGRQLAEERTLGARFELDLGRVEGRAAAEELKARAESVGVPALVVRDAQGRYRVAAGPFSAESQARAAAERLETRLGVAPRIRERAP